ncbi:hypothetical protein M413DRAFT_77077 [Hebeloma cylindrosporum]|uniref:Protoporphyrinogen oxidase n=1 Tax=Hebeloma cylindrosporum TaxID=76867 RepID=A0A0C2Y8W6_HEBCY|nr:hypothetical protein M413DRAFT_77077 [Hebeloma cylindrosporum h7]
MPQSIAILGGGLTGLSSAYHLSRRFPTSKIVLLERQARLGGWVRSNRVDLNQIGASVLLEAGPRTLRPNGKCVLELINLLGLEDKVITIPKTAPAAKSRFLYIPESHHSKVSGLQRLPNSILSLLNSPLLSILLPAILREPFKGANRPPRANDESVDSFLTRRFGETFARVFGSALVHGIYATDSRKLSVRAAFPSMWDAEERGRGSLVRGLLVPPRKLKDEQETYELGRTLEMMNGVSVYSFKDGMESLTKALEDHLGTLANVRILVDTRISRIKMVDDQLLEISHSGGEPLRTSHAVSALPLPVLHKLVSKSPSFDIPHLTQNPTSTVHVVNLIFPTAPKNIHPEGFGYLIPRPPSGYPDPSTTTNTGILGTVFDSCSLHAQDLPHTTDYYNKASHTKLTVMTGGPYPTLPLPSQFSSSEGGADPVHIPAFIRSLLEALKVQLGRELPDPIYWRIWNNEECIPTLMPGHLDRMQDLKTFLMSSGGWGGRLAVVGAGVGGVSVGDCVEAGRRVGRDWV